MVISTCSIEFQKGIQWLENNVKFDEKLIRSQLKEINEQIMQCENNNIPYELKHQKEILEKKLKLRYFGYDIEQFYILNKIKSPIYDSFVISTKNNLFWEDIKFLMFEGIHRIRYFLDLGFQNNSYIKKWISEILNNQTIEGALHGNPEEHTGAMWVLSKFMPNSLNLQRAVEWWLKNWKEYRDINNISFGILALIDLDYQYFKEEIEEHIDYLKSLQNEEGYWTHIKNSDGWKIIDTFYAIWAISKYFGPHDLIAINALNWLLKLQMDNGSWFDRVDYTAYALIGLLLMGKGPKISEEVANNRILKYKQILRKHKPIFLHTSPIYKKRFHITNIYDEILEMLKRAKREIRISSLFIDVLYENIINITHERPELIIKIITRPKKDIKGIREKIAKNVIDLLEIATKGNIVKSEIIHARLIIIDDKEMLISSADLTRDQLFDEFNAGIKILDRDAILEAIEFFDNIYELEKEKIKS